MSVTFKPAEFADVDLLLELMREFYALESLAFAEPAARSALRRFIGEDALGKVWLIESGGDGGPVGYVVLAFGFSLELHGLDAFIDEFYVRADYQGRGVGGRTLEFVEETSRVLGVMALHLEVGRSNSRAQRLYRKHGFEDREQYLMTKKIAPKI